MFRGLQRYWRSVTRRSRLPRLASLDWWQSVLPVWLTLDFYWQIVSYPFRWFLAAWHERTIRSFLWGFPALSMIIVLALVFHRMRLQSQSVSYFYWEDAQAAILAKDYARAEMLLDRILHEGRAHVQDAKFGLAVVYSEIGHAERADLLLSALAPDDGSGYPEAHRRRAIQLARSVSKNSKPEDLELLHSQLRAASGQDTAEMASAWALYSLAIQDLESARKYLEKSVAKFPEYWILLAEVNYVLGNTSASAGNYKSAEAYLENKLRSDSDSRPTRVDYAKVLVRQGRLDAAEGALKEGLQSDPDGNWDKLLADLYVHHHDSLSQEQTHPIEILLDLLSRALSYDPDSGAALNRLMGYVREGDGINTELMSMLRDIISKGGDAALPHLALGNLYWIEQNTSAAILHFERAIELNSKLAVVMNNLAWLLANDPAHQDLDRALGLVEAALKERPDDASFLDTRGTILLKLGRHREALKDLEAALAGVRDRAGVHARLAAVYRELGDSAMADQHLEREREAREQASQTSRRPGT